MRINMRSATFLVVAIALAKPASSQLTYAQVSASLDVPTPILVQGPGHMDISQSMLLAIRTPLGIHPARGMADLT
jgi:hypothetical protein